MNSRLSRQKTVKLDDECNVEDDKSNIKRSASAMNNDDKLTVTKRAEELHKIDLTHRLFIKKSSQLEIIFGEKHFDASENISDFEIVKINRRNQLNEDNGDDYHFRLAESQFYRLIYGTEDRPIADYGKNLYKVKSVDRVINSKLMKKFELKKQYIHKNRGSDYTKIILGFHGTKQENIDNICREGFRMPTDDNYEQTSDSGYYGRGIYFSQYPTYAMNFITGCSRLLLCQLLMGRVYSCIGLAKHGQSQEPNYDTHMSPSGKELVIFDSDQILPCYIVNYEIVKYEDLLDQNLITVPRYNSKFDLIDPFGSEELTSKKRRLAESDDELKLKRSKKGLLCDKNVYLDLAKLSESKYSKIKKLVEENQGNIVSDSSGFDLLVIIDTDDLIGSPLVRIANEQNIPCIECDNLQKCLEDCTNTNFKDILKYLWV